MRATGGPRRRLTTTVPGGITVPRRVAFPFLYVADSARWKSLVTVHLLGGVMFRSVKCGLLFLASLMLIPAAASAQGSIAGVVRDASGAVLPGVTIEAS